MGKQYIFWRSDLSNGWLELMSYNPVEEGRYKTSERIMEYMNSTKYDSRLISPIDRSYLIPRNVTYCYTDCNHNEHYTNYNGMYTWVPELSDVYYGQNPTPVSFLKNGRLLFVDSYSYSVSSSTYTLKYYEGTVYNNHFLDASIDHDGSSYSHLGIRLNLSKVLMLKPTP